MYKYLEILKTITQDGNIKPNRTGIDTLSIFNYNYGIEMEHGFPLLTTRELNWKSILIENLWFLGKSSSPAFLHKHGVKFWNPWIEEDGNLPKAYGEYWRAYPKWGEWDGMCHVKTFDQFNAIIEGLKKDPNNRRLVLTNWYPPSAWTAKLPPCHLMSIFNVQYVRSCPELNLHLTQRSCDVPVGVPFNIAGYAFILELVSHLTGIKSGRFGHTLVDAHIYENQLLGVHQQIKRLPRNRPRLKIDDSIKTLNDVDALIKEATTEQIMNTFKIDGYNPHPPIRFPVAV